MHLNTQQNKCIHKPLKYTENSVLSSDAAFKFVLFTLLDDYK